MRRNSVSIVGAAETTDLGKIPGLSQIQLHADAALNAIADAGLKLSDIDGIASAGESPTNLSHYLGLVPTGLMAPRSEDVPLCCMSATRQPQSTRAYVTRFSSLTVKVVVPISGEVPFEVVVAVRYLVNLRVPMAEWVQRRPSLYPFCVI